MQKTSNYGLNKPDGTDTVDVSVLNGNMDTIDIKLKSNADDTAALGEKVSSHLADYTKHPGYAVATGSANTYAVTLSPAPTNYIDGMGIVVKINTTNTGASTININGLGAKSIKDSLGNAITSGGLKANTPYTLRYESTSGNFILQGKGGGGNATSADLFSGKIATVDSGQITGSNPYKVGATILEDNLTILHSGGQEVWSNSDTINATGIAVDSSGNVYVAYSGSGKTVRKLNSSGQEIWSNSDDPYARGIAVDNNENVYVTYSTSVKKLNSDGTQMWSNSDVANGLNTAVDSSGNVYVTYCNSSGTKTVRKLNNNGQEIWSNSSMTNPTGIAVDSSGNVYVAYYQGVKMLNSSGQEIWTNLDAAYTVGIAVDSGKNVYVTYSTNSAIREAKLNSSGQRVWVNTESGTTATGITVSNNGSIYVTFYYNSVTVRKLNNDGTKIWYLADNMNATGIAVDSSENVYVAYCADSGFDTARKLYGSNIYTLS